MLAVVISESLVMLLATRDVVRGKLLAASLVVTMLLPSRLSPIGMSRASLVALAGLIPESLVMRIIRQHAGTGTSTTVEVTLEACAPTQLAVEQNPAPAADPVAATETRRTKTIKTTMTFVMMIPFA